MRQFSYSRIFQHYYNYYSEENKSEILNFFSKVGRCSIKFQVKIDLNYIVCIKIKIHGEFLWYSSFNKHFFAYGWKLEQHEKKMKCLIHHFKIWKEEIHTVIFSGHIPCFIRKLKMIVKYILVSKIDAFEMWFIVSYWYTKLVSIPKTLIDTRN